MKLYEKTQVVETHASRLIQCKVKIYKFVKTGTKRVFFAPEVDGKRINTTMYARLYDASKVARNYISLKESNT